MNSYKQMCCGSCTNSAENPCALLIQCANEGPLCHHDEKCAKKIKETGEYHRHERVNNPLIFIGMGTCGLASGAAKVWDAIQAELTKLQLDAEMIPVGCVGFCAKEVIVDIKMPGLPRISYGEITPKIIPSFIKKVLIDKGIYTEKFLGVYGESFNGLSSLSENIFFKHQQKIVLKSCGVINPESIDEYIARGGFRALDKVLRRMKPAQVVDEVTDSGLRGRGGAGFLTGTKWKIAANQNSEIKYLVCNADEGDPGAFMDRSVLESDPFRVLEGMIIAGFAIGASFGYIYCRAEYPLAISRLLKTIKLAEEYGLLGKNILGSGFSFTIKIKKGAGAFVCGEETALIASIEGRRGMPRPRPPFPVVSGIFGHPTVINNVETFANVSSIIEHGSSWFNKIGTEKSKGTKVFALSGKIQYSGLVEVPMGTTLRDVVFTIGGGIPDNKKFKAVQIGGPSGGCLPESVIDTPVDYDSLKQVGAMMGSGGFVVMDEDTCMVDVARYFLTFIQNESCGKCVPCREGTKRLLEIVDRIPESYKSTKSPERELMRFKGVIYLRRLAEVIKDSALCGLGQSAPNPVLSGLQYFKEEYEEHLYERKCRAGACKDLLTFSIDNTLCTGCGICLRKCSADAIVGEKGQAHYIISDKCTKCGMCIESCSFKAVSAV